VDIDEIKHQVTLQMIFDHYGLAGTRQGSEVRLICPFHDDTHPSLCANIEKGIWQCFGCGLTGDALAFVMRHDRIDTGDRNADRLTAARYLAETFGIETPHPERPRAVRRQRPQERTPPVKEAVTPNAQHHAAVAADVTTSDEDASTNAYRVNPPLAFALKHLDTRHPYLLHDRGLRPETIDHFGLGFYSGRGVMSGRAVIPIHNEQGELVAYAGRVPGEPPEGAPKYRFPLNFRKSLVVFNLHRAREHAGKGLIVCEGFFDVFAFFERHRKNAVAIMGSSLSQEQERLLIETVGPRGRLLIAFDPDEAGRKGMHDAAERLVSRVFVRTVELS
jgi:DNA primase